MILRSLAQALRRQDWLAIAIEFLIVVAGIFVALQVTDWNEQRQLRARELNYLQRMAEDVARMESAFDQILARGGGRSAVALRAFRALEHCDRSLARPEDFRIVLAGYQNQPTPMLITRTYAEMVSSGALASMADRELSGAIASLFGALADYKTFVQGVRVSLPVVDRVLWSHVDFSYDDEGRPTLRQFDFASACRNRELRNAVWEVRDLLQDWETTTVQTVGQLRQFAEQLDRHLAAQVGGGAH
jgi:hypothetical protein